MCKIFNFSLKTTKVLDLLQGVAKSEEGQVTSTVKVKNEQHKLKLSFYFLTIQVHLSSLSFPHECYFKFDNN